MLFGWKKKALELEEKMKGMEKQLEENENVINKLENKNNKIQRKLGHYRGIEKRKKPRYTRVR